MSEQQGLAVLQLLQHRNWRANVDVSESLGGTTIPLESQVSAAMAVLRRCEQRVDKAAALVKATTKFLRRACTGEGAVSWQLARAALAVSDYQPGRRVFACCCDRGGAQKRQKALTLAPQPRPRHCCAATPTRHKFTPKLLAFETARELASSCFTSRERP